MADINCTLGQLQVTGLQATLENPDELTLGRIILQGHPVDFVVAADGENTWPGDGARERTWWSRPQTRTWND